MKKIKIFASLASIFLSLCSISNPLPAAEVVRALLAIDTDSNLSASVKQDRKIFRSLLQALHKQGAHVISTELSGKDLSRKNVRRWIDRIPNHTDQRIIFYFSGHGTRLKKMPSPWPILAFQDGKEFMSGSEIKSALEQKKSPLLVFLTDCCNKAFVQKTIQPFTPVFSHSTRGHDALASLFLKTTGSVAITASQPGYNAIGFRDTGGLMTTLFAASILDMPASNTNWQMVVSYMKKNGKKFKQTPYHEIDISRP